MAGACVAVAVLLVSTNVAPDRLALASLGASALLAGLWLFASPNLARSSLVLMAYLCLLDGFLKLRFGGAGFVLARDVLIAALAGGVVLRWSVKRAPLPRVALIGALAGWLAACSAQILNPANPSILTSVAALRQHVEFVPLFLVGYLVLRTRARVRWFLFALLLFTLMNALVSVVQFNLTPDQFARWGPGYDRLIHGTGVVTGRSFLDQGGQTRVRPFGLGSDIGFAGGLAVLAIPAALALLVCARTFGSRLCAVMLLAGVVLAVVTSQSRTTVVAAVLSAGIYCAFVSLPSLSHGRSAKHVGLIAVLVAVILTMSVAALGSDRFGRYASLVEGPGVIANTYEYRLGAISLVPANVRHHPLGVGLGVLGPASSLGTTARAPADVTGETEINFLLAEVGLPGLLAMLVFHLGALRIAWLALGVASHDNRVLLAGVLVPLYIILALWWAGAQTAAPPSAPFLWFGAGVAAWWAHAGTQACIRGRWR